MKRSQWFPAKPENAQPSEFELNNIKQSQSWFRNGTVVKGKKKRKCLIHAKLRGEDKSVATPAKIWEAFKMVPIYSNNSPESPPVTLQSLLISLCIDHYMGFSGGSCISSYGIHLTSVTLSRSAGSSGGLIVWGKVIFMRRKCPEYSLPLRWSSR